MFVYRGVFILSPGVFMFIRAYRLYLPGVYAYFFVDYSILSRAFIYSRELSLFMAYLFIFFLSLCFVIGRFVFTNSGSVVIRGIRGDVILGG